jgi:hypothetical protein
MIQHSFTCVCGQELFVTVSQVYDKAGKYCDNCSRVYDVWYDGRVEQMPLPKGAKVSRKGILGGPGYTPVKVD